MKLFLLSVIYLTFFMYNTDLPFVRPTENVIPHMLSFLSAMLCFIYSIFFIVVSAFCPSIKENEVWLDLDRAFFYNDNNK